MKNCLVCKKEINKKGNYCNRKCLDIYKRLRKINKLEKLNNIYIKHCLECNERIVSLIDKIYCKKHTPKKVKVERVFLNCKKCNIEIKTGPSNKQYCSIKCRKGFESKPIPKIGNCINCNKEFSPKKHNQIICQIKCKKYVIYKISVKDLNYIGMTKNFKVRKNTHLFNIKKTLRNEKLYYDKKYTFKELFNKKDFNGGVPAVNAVYFKIHCYILMNNLTEQDIKIEVIDWIDNFKEQCENERKWVQKLYGIKLDDSQVVELIEHRYMKEYNSHLEGFNGPHTFLYKIHVLINKVGLKEDDKIIKYYSALHKQISKRCKNNIIDNKYKSWWIIWNYGEVFETEYNNIYLGKIKEIKNILKV